MKNVKIMAAMIAGIMVLCSMVAIAHTGFPGHPATNHQNSIPGKNADPRCSDSWWDGKTIVGNWYYTESNKIWSRMPNLARICDD